MDKIKVGISACLMGQRVRYDGGDKLDLFLRDTLGRYIEWVPVCPEVECGLPVPREAMRLVGAEDSPHLITSRTGVDLTGQMQSWIKQRIKELAGEGLCGFVFKTRSPSSGLRDAKIYTTEGMPYAKGPGLFAKAFTEAFPLLPVEDEGRLHNPDLRESFIEKLFVYYRWQAFLQDDASVAGLVEFHSHHKLLLMAHSPKHAKSLGNIVANAKGRSSEALDAYATALKEALDMKATPSKHTNALQHMMGYFKKQLSPDEKQELLEVLDAYRKGLIPLIVPMTLLQHYVRKYNEPYLKSQVYLNPHPLELKLRNHA